MKWFILIASIAGFILALTSTHFNTSITGAGKKYIPTWWQRTLLAAFFASMAALMLKSILLK